MIPGLEPHRSDELPSWETRMTLGEEDCWGPTRSPSGDVEGQLDTLTGLESRGATPSGKWTGGCRVVIFETVRLGEITWAWSAVRGSRGFQTPLPSPEAHPVLAFQVSFSFPFSKSEAR